jgi:hypothetical protein
VKGGEQAEKADRHQHVYPAAVPAHDHRHRFRQRVVDPRELLPVTRPAGEDHHAEREHHERENAGDVAARNRDFGVLYLLRGHRDAFDRKEEPDGEGNRREHAAHTRGRGVFHEIIE